MKPIDDQLVEYAALIRARWLGLSDGERLRLMAMCCRECGALAGRCSCPWPFDPTLPWRCPRCGTRFAAMSDSTVAHRAHGQQLCITCTQVTRK